MKFELATIFAKPDAKIIIKNGDTLLLGIKSGLYVVNFIRGTAEFFPKLKLESVVQAIASDVDVGNMLEYEFCEEDKAGGVKNYIGPVVKVHDGKKWRRFAIEYYDATKGKIQSYKRNASEQEVYLSVEEPFEAKVYDYGERREFFAQHTIVIKRI